MSAIKTLNANSEDTNYNELFERAYGRYSEPGMLKVITENKMNESHPHSEGRTQVMDIN